MVALLDVNVLVALAWPTHMHHELVHQWLEHHKDRRWATCPLTQSGFVRVSSNRHVIPAAKSPREALQALESMLAHPHHVFLPDDLSIADRQWVAVEKLIGYRQVTDAHLLGVALKNSAQCVTLDHSMVSLVPAGFDPKQAVTVIA
jgi:hypothetical protein